MNEDFLTVRRLKSEADWCLSTLEAQDGKKLCCGVEDEVRTVKLFGEMCIPAGRYPLGLRNSPRFSHEYYTRDGVTLITAAAYKLLTVKTGYKEHDTIWVQNIPGFQYVLFHWGNTDDDTDGCYIVGRSHAWIGKQRGVETSRATYITLYAKIAAQIRAGNKYITYLNA